MDESLIDMEKYFQDFEISEVFSSNSRVITDTDLVEFAELTGDHNLIHMDSDHAKKTGYQDRIAHGLLTTSIVSGLAAQLGLTTGTAIAIRYIKWKFQKPVYINDKIRATYTVRKKRKIKDMAGGLVIFDVSVINQNEIRIQSGEWGMVIRSR